MKKTISQNPKTQKTITSSKKKFQKADQSRLESSKISNRKSKCPSEPEDQEQISKTKVDNIIRLLSANKKYQPLEKNLIESNIYNKLKSIYDYLA